METANESGNGFHGEAFVVFEKGLRWLKYKKNVTLCSYLCWKNHVTSWLKGYGIRNKYLKNLSTNLNLYLNE